MSDDDRLKEKLEDIYDRVYEECAETDVDLEKSKSKIQKLNYRIERGKKLIKECSYELQYCHHKNVIINTPLLGERYYPLKHLYDKNIKQVKASETKLKLYKERKDLLTEKFNLLRNRIHLLIFLMNSI